MAAANALRSLQEEATCSICLEYYREPVITACGHNFCRACISVCAQGHSGAPDPQCPQCREPCPQAELRPNRQLQSMVEIARQLSLQPAERAACAGSVCGEHEERLKLFCEQDRALICLVCRESSEHRGHAVYPVKEAAGTYKNTLEGWLPPLRKEMDSVLASKLKEEADFKSVRDKLVAEKQKTLAEFEGMHQLLRDKEQTILGKLEEMEVKLSKVEQAKVTKLSLQMSSLGALITEIEATCKQPAEELLKEVSSTLSKCENITFQESGTRMEKKMGEKKPLKKNMRKQAFPSMKLMVDPKELIKNYKVKVTLDPDTAHQSLTLSEGGRRASGAAQAKNRSKFLHNPEMFALAQPTKKSLFCYNEEMLAPRVTQNAKRFTASHCVLGMEGYSSGRHYWELQLLQNQGVSLGIAGESAMEQVWVLWAVKYEHSAQYGGQHPPSSLYDQSFCFQPLVHLSLKNLGVYLDYDRGQLSVYNTDTMQPLYTFKGAAFTQTVYPYFMLEDGADLRLM